MAEKTFDEWVAQIKSAIYGEEVRTAIVEALKKAYNKEGDSDLTPAEIATVRTLIKQLGPKVNQIEPNTITLSSMSDSERSKYGNSAIKLGESIDNYNRVVFYYADNLSHQYGSTEFYKPANGFANFTFDLYAVEAASVISTFVRRQRFIVDSGLKIIHTYTASGDGTTLGGGGVFGVNHSNLEIFGTSLSSYDIITIYKVVGYKE